MFPGKNWAKKTKVKIISKRDNLFEKKVSVYKKNIIIF